MDALQIEEAHIVGFHGRLRDATFWFDYPSIVLVVGGCGYGAEPNQRESFKSETLATVEKIKKRQWMLLASICFRPNEGAISK